MLLSNLHAKVEFYSGGGDYDANDFELCVNGNVISLSYAEDDGTKSVWHGEMKRPGHYRLTHDGHAHTFMLLSTVEGQTAIPWKGNSRTMKGGPGESA